MDCRINVKTTTASPLEPLQCASAAYYLIIIIIIITTNATTTTTGSNSINSNSISRNTTAIHNMTQQSALIMGRIDDNQITALEDEPCLLINADVHAPSVHMRLTFISVALK